MRSHRTVLLILKAFALVCVSIRGLAIDGSESAFLALVESGSAPADAPLSSDARPDLFDVLGTSMTYLPSDGPRLAEPEQDRMLTGSTPMVSVEALASTLLKPPCA